MQTQISIPYLSKKSYGQTEIYRFLNLNRMIVTKLEGGLGNQMFQYACARNLSILLNSEVGLDLSSYSNSNNVSLEYTPRNFELNIFNAKYRILNRVELKKLYFNQRLSNFISKLGISVFQNKPITEHNFSEISFKKNENYYLQGYWQSEQYFKTIRNILIDELTLKSTICDQSSMQSLIKNTNSVSIHIRRGDYLTNKAAFAVHGLCSLDYFMIAINYTKSVITHPHFFIFSDDLNWAKNNFNFESNIHFVENTKPEIEQYMMSCCKHNIISNSSFSWWGAWLNKNDNKLVIAPKKWFQIPQNLPFDIIPERWVKL